MKKKVVIINNKEVLDKVKKECHKYFSNLKDEKINEVFNKILK